MQHMWGIGWNPQQEDIDHPLKEFITDQYHNKEKIDEYLTDPATDKNCNEYKEKEVLRLFYKLILNSIYGKTAERVQDDRYKFDLAEGFFQPDKASLITGTSRAILNKYMQKCMPVYCDTDSVITKRSLDTSNKLGAMKLEHKGHTCVVRSKLYYIEKKDEVKKVAHHGIRLGTEDSYQFMKSMKGIKRVYDKRRMTKLKEAYRRHCNPRSWIEQSFTLTAAEDGKRVYDEKFVSMEELRTDNTLSIPLQYALNNRDLTE